ncbi:LysR family transcriptional regulator [Sorangium sp. So ce1014]|uniref:LysR family transcriptional regulator n=1 Tax=Sorangium sp. So ce1014 TaxID=3133326 RepID=UPI003F5FEFD1
MDLEELQAFLHVVKQGSFHAAAEATGMSRTTLRRRVESLQARAGVSLLESNRQGVVLTEAGRALAGRGQAMVEEASALVSSIRELGREPSGLLRLVLPVGLPPHLMAPLYASIRSAYPQLRLSCQFSNDPLSESLVDIDVAVHFGEGAPRGPWLSLAIMRIRERLCASKEYLARRGTPASIDDLAGHELLSWRAPGEDASGWPTRNGGRFPVEPALIATDIHLVRQCCLAGLGVALIPDAMIDGPAGDELVTVLPDIVGRERAVRVTVPEALSEIPKVKMVLTHVRRFLRGVTD